MFLLLSSQSMRILESASLIPLHHLIEDDGVVFTKGNAFFSHKINADRGRLRAGMSSSELQSDTQLPLGQPVTQELLLKVGQHHCCIVLLKVGSTMAAIKQVAQSLRVIFARTVGA
jgi:hypothetical protein